MEDPESPQYGAHSRSRSRAERAQERANREAFERGETTPVKDQQEIEDLKARLTQMENRWNNVRGEGGINWNGGVISLNQRAIRNPAADAGIAPIQRYHPFQVYPTGAASVQVATGTILTSEADITAIASITAKDNTFTVSDGDWIYIETTFDADGTITACEMKKAATWASYPSLTTAGPGNTWIHPIANIRAPLSGKAAIDPGEEPQIGAAFIAQKTNTHLVVVQDCLDGDLIWKLQPGEGGED